MIDPTEAGQYDPFDTGEESAPSGEALPSVAEALGFITEFNLNVAIFNTISGVLLSLILGTHGTVRRHTTDIVQIRRDMELLRQAIGAAHVAAVARAEAEYRADYVASHNRGYTGRGR